MNLIDVIIPAVTGLLTFLLGQQRGKKEVESLHLSNIEKALSIYQHIVSDLKEEILHLNKKVDVLQDKVDALMEENHTLKKMLSDKV
jgi:peptidoglycan hydrolase CwlO-like protein